MDCNVFQNRINDFIFDKIEYSDEIETFLNHAKECAACNEELSLYYSIRRSLGDVSAPNVQIEAENTNEELKQIKDFYEDLFRKRRIIKKTKILFGFFALIFVAGLLTLCFTGLLF